MDQNQEIRLDFKTLDREQVMADMISEKNGIIRQLATEVQQLRAENEQLKVDFEKRTGKTSGEAT